MDMATKPEFIRVIKNEIAVALLCSPVVGKRMVPPFDNLTERPFGIVEDHLLHVGAPEVHTHEDDLWIGLEGEAVFTVGGSLVEPYFRKLEGGGEDTSEIKGKSIVGGKIIVMRPGDILWIPAGVPHMHTAYDTARLLIYKSPRRS